jgi:hypothetical protein
MRVLIDIGHPATVHFFSVFSQKMKENGHEVKFIARSKDVTIALLEHYKMDYVCIGKTKSNVYLKLFGILEFSLIILKISISYHPCILLGSGGVYFFLTSLILRIPIVINTNTEVDPLMRVYKYFVSSIITPSSFKFVIPGEKIVQYPGNCEVAHLHPKYFRPDVNVLKKYNISESDKFILVRFVSITASDDFHVCGIDDRSREILIDMLLNYGQLLISSETNLKGKLASYQLETNPVYATGDLQSLEYYADLFIGDSGAMTSECAVLGTPAVYLSNKNLGFIDELTNKYELSYQYTSIDHGLKKIKELLETDHLKETWNSKKVRFLNDTIDVSEFMVWFIENYPRSKKIMIDNPNHIYSFR